MLNRIMKFNVMMLLNEENEDIDKRKTYYRSRY